MKIRSINVAVAMGAAALVANAVTQEARANDVGAAVVTVETEPPGLQGSFIFDGTPGGTVTAGGRIAQAGLVPGVHETMESGAPPDLVLVSITCDDGDSATPSSGAIEARQATFNIDPREMVTCVFLYRAPDLAENRGGAASSGSGSGGAAAPGGPGGAAPPGGSGGTPAPDESADCEAPELVPRAGLWDVSNFTGSMVCGAMINMPLKASQETGVLEIRDCGWTVYGTGLAEDTAPLTMRAVDATSGRYTGSVGGMQDGISMTINFTWQVNTEESIVGDLFSEVTEQGMTCRMSRSFALKYAGPQLP